VAAAAAGGAGDVTDATDRDEVLETCLVLVERLINGLRRVMEIRRKEPHYIAALTIAAGCEAIGRLLESVDGKCRDDEDIFVEELILPHGGGAIDAAMARDSSTRFETVSPTPSKQSRSDLRAAARLISSSRGRVSRTCSGAGSPSAST
jgi:hypothetical protein